MTEDPIAVARREGRTALTEPEAKRLLADAGVDVPVFEVAESADAAADAADRIGYPAVTKVVAPEIRHKSEWARGLGVQVGLASAEAVEAAAGEILDAADETGVDAAVLVEEAADVTSGTEVIVGGTRDPSFGPAVLVGLGGVFTEVYEDTAHRLAPLSRAEARRAIGELRAATLLEGYRTRAPADLDALADAVVAVGDLLVAREAVAEVDLNPVLASPEGALALDALVVLSEEPGEADD